MHLSPFEFQRPLRPGDVTGRDQEIDEIVATAAAGRALTVVAPRRYGKTSVLGVAAERLHDLGHTVVQVDLYGLASKGELTVRLERGWSRTRGPLRGAATRVLDAANIGLSLSGAGFSAALSRQPAADPLPALHALLSLPERVATANSRAVVIFDEFQALGALDGIEGLIRSHVQHHGDVASYVFAGSEPHLISAQFDSPDRPFYGQSLRLRLDRPTRTALADRIRAGFDATDRDPGDALGPLLDLADRHPQRAMLLAHFMWEHTPEDGTATLAEWSDARETARGHVLGEAQALFNSASPNQRRLLRLLASDLSPYAGDALRRVGLEVGSVTRTLGQLDRDGYTEDADGLRIIDPMMADWIRHHLPA